MSMEGIRDALREMENQMLAGELTLERWERLAERVRVNGREIGHPEVMEAAYLFKPGPSESDS